MMHGTMNVKIPSIICYLLSYESLCGYREELERFLNAKKKLHYYANILDTSRRW
jgi:hypothetical protein